jgi:hypothetical protein
MTLSLKIMEKWKYLYVVLQHFPNHWNKLQQIINFHFQKKTFNIEHYLGCTMWLKSWRHVHCIVYELLKYNYNIVAKRKKLLWQWMVSHPLLHLENAYPYLTRSKALFTYFISLNKFYSFISWFYNKIAWIELHLQHLKNVSFRAELQNFSLSRRNCAWGGALNCTLSGRYYFLAKCCWGPYSQCQKGEWNLIKHSIHMLCLEQTYQMIFQAVLLLVGTLTRKVYWWYYIKGGAMHCILSKQCNFFGRSFELINIY